MHGSRHTVTLYADVEELIKQAMTERGAGFKEVVNDAIRIGLARKPRKRLLQRTFNMGKPRIDLTKALQLAADLEDEEIIRKMQSGK